MPWSSLSHVLNFKVSKSLHNTGQSKCSSNYMRDARVIWVVSKGDSGSAKNFFSRLIFILMPTVFHLFYNKI